jgi:hypothetical protein
MGGAQMDIDHILRKAQELLSYTETEKIRDVVLNLDRQGFTILGVVTGVLVLLCLIKKMYRTATLIVALCAVAVLLHYTIPATGVQMELSQLVLLFLGGTFIVASAIYIIFIRTD